MTLGFEEGSLVGTLLVDGDIDGIIEGWTKSLLGLDVGIFVGV